MSVIEHKIDLLLCQFLFSNFRLDRFTLSLEILADFLKLAFPCPEIFFVDISIKAHFNQCVKSILISIHLPADDRQPCQKWLIFCMLFHLVCFQPSFKHFKINQPSLDPLPDQTIN